MMRFSIISSLLVSLVKENKSVSTVSSSHSQRCMWSSNSWEEKWGQREGEPEPLRDSHHATPCVCSYLRRQTASVDFLRMLSSVIGSQWDSSDGSLCQWMDCPLEALLLALGLSVELYALFWQVMIIDYWWLLSSHSNDDAVSPGHLMDLPHAGWVKEINFIKVVE